MSTPRPRIEELHAYHDGELGALGRWWVRRRLARDPAARRELAELAELRELLREREEALESPDLWPGIRPRLALREPAAPHAVRAGGRRWNLAWVPVGLAATAAVVLLAVGLAGGDAPAASSVRWLDTGGRSAAVLQDDREATIIWILDTGSEQSARRTERALG